MSSSSSSPRLAGSSWTGWRSASPYQDPSNVARWQAAGGGVRCRGNTWFMPYDTIQSRDKDRPHPATFPPRLPEYCLRLHGLERVKTVADPFLGLGSTAVACATLGVDFVGIELDEGYLNEAIERTRAALNGSHTGQRAKKAPAGLDAAERRRR